MTQEDKELLLKDLCARLPYGVIVYDYDKEETREMGLGTFHDIMFNDLKCKPYLRPKSSISDLITAKEWSSLGGINLIDWYNANHIDYRGLIPLGLALEAPEDMYK